MTIPTERPGGSVTPDQRPGHVPNPTVLRWLIPLLTRLLHAAATVRTTFALAGAEARSALAERELDEHFATAPRDDTRFWPTPSTADGPVLLSNGHSLAPPWEELDGPDYQSVVAHLLAIGKVDTAAPVDQVLLHVDDRAQDTHPRDLHVAATYLQREFVALVRSTP